MFGDDPLTFWNELVRYLAIAVSTCLGIIGTIGETKRNDKLTRWGVWTIVGIVLSSAIGAMGQAVDFLRQQDSARRTALANAKMHSVTLDVLRQANRAVYPLTRQISLRLQIQLDARCRHSELLEISRAEADETRASIGSVSDVFFVYPPAFLTYASSGLQARVAQYWKDCVAKQVPTYIKIYVDERPPRPEPQSRHFEIVGHPPETGTQIEVVYRRNSATLEYDTHPLHKVPASWIESKNFSSLADFADSRLRAEIYPALRAPDYVELITETGLKLHATGFYDVKQQNKFGSWVEYVTQLPTGDVWH